jgi:cytochrome c oxidase assembly protein subunit 15
MAFKVLSAAFAIVLQANFEAVPDNYKNKAVAYWLLTGVIMIIGQVLLGGITRLTGSGLSITEWKPIMGAIPPLNEHEWTVAFDKYKQIAQFKYLNSHFQLSDFKFLFFWEWFHRLWARLIGVVFAVGFIYFLIRRYFNKEMVIPFIILFILGAVQGLVGWIMVASGLNDTSLYVNHIKLAIHFIAALVLLCYTLWFALQLLIPAEKRVSDPRLHNLTVWIIGLLCIQLIYGAFMAGLKAAMSAATWPTINGMWIPDNMMHQSFINNPINVHFVHRTLAYILFCVVIWWFIKTKQQQTSLLNKTRWWPLLLVITQVVLGIVTVLSAPHIVFGKFGQFELLAEMHQLVAMFLLMSLVINLYIIKAVRR